MPETGWYTMQDIAEMTGKHVRKVRVIVQVLSNAGSIRTRKSRDDERLTEVWGQDIEIVKRALRADDDQDVTA